MPLAGLATIRVGQGPVCDAASIETSCSGDSMMKTMSIDVCHVEREQSSEHALIQSQ